MPLRWGLKMDAEAQAGSSDTPRVGLLQIGLTFLRIGSTSFSLAALGEIRAWMTEKRRWFSEEEYIEGLCLAQLLPGAPTVNLSSYLGFRLRGLPGAAVASVCFLAPGFLLMLLLSYLYLTYGELPVVSGLFRGLGALVVGLVLNTIANLWASGVATVFKGVMAVAGFIAVFWFDIGMITVALMSGGAGIIVVLLVRRFPILNRCTGSWSEIGGKAETASCNRGSESAQPPLGVTNNASAAGREPRPLDLRRMVLLVVCLALMLAADLFLIRLQPELLQMGSRFLRIGALVFGSGYAMLPFIHDTVVGEFAWLTDQQFAVALALSLITPGPVTIVAAFVGFKVAGLTGALAGTANMYFPAWAMTTIVAGPYARAGKLGSVRQVIGGIVAAFIGTLVVVLIRLGANTLVDIPTVAMATGAFIAQRFLKIDTGWIVVAGAVVSLACFR